MKRGTSLTLPGIVILGVLLSAGILLLVLGVIKISRQFSAEIENAERFLNEGKLEEAAAIANKIRNNTFGKAMVKGKVFLLRAIQQQRNEGWQQYGTDSADWLKGEDADSAVYYFTRALEASPRSATAYYYTGITCKERGWLNKAEDALLQAVILDSISSNIRLSLASLYVLQGNIEAAEKHLKMAVVTDQNNPEVAKNLGFLYRYYSENPESAAIYLSLFLKNARKGDIDIQRAKMEVEELRRRYPEYSIPPIVAPDGEQRRIFIPRK